PLPLPRPAPRRAERAREREAHRRRAGGGARHRPRPVGGGTGRQRGRAVRLGHGRRRGARRGGAVIPGRDGERQGFRDEALRVEVALDAGGAAAYRGSRPASLYVERVGPAGAPTVYYLHGGPGYNAAS